MRISGCDSDALCLASQFIVNTMSGLVLFARYIRIPLSLRYEYSAPKTTSPSCFGLNGSISFFQGVNDHMSHLGVCFAHIEFLQYFLDISRLVYKNTRLKMFYL
jgi:hypothetical protein